MYGFQYNEKLGFSQQYTIDQSMTFMSILFITLSVLSIYKQSMNMYASIFTEYNNNSTQKNKELDLDKIIDVIKEANHIELTLKIFNILFSIYVLCSILFGKNKFNVPKRYLFSSVWAIIFIIVINANLFIENKAIKEYSNYKYYKFQIYISLILLAIIFIINSNTSLDDHKIVYHKDTNTWIINSEFFEDHELLCTGLGGINIKYNCTNNQLDITYLPDISNAKLDASIDEMHTTIIKLLNNKTWSEPFNSMNRIIQTTDISMQTISDDLNTALGSYINIFSIDRYYELVNNDNFYYDTLKSNDLKDIENRLLSNYSYLKCSLIRDYSKLLYTWNLNGHENLKEYLNELINLQTNGKLKVNDLTIFVDNLNKLMADSSAYLSRDSTSYSHLTNKFNGQYEELKKQILKLAETVDKIKDTIHYSVYMKFDTSKSTIKVI